MKTRFHYLRDDRRRPVVTICRIETEEGAGIGTAICCKRDLPPFKAVGRAVAEGRALKAIRMRRSSEAIVPLPVSVSVEPYAPAYRWIPAVQELEFEGGEITL